MREQIEALIHTYEKKSALHRGLMGVYTNDEYEDEKRAYRHDGMAETYDKVIEDLQWLLEKEDMKNGNNC